MEFEEYVLNQLEIHRSVLPCDIVKLCYQASFGAEHLIEDKTSAEKYFFGEYNNIQPRRTYLLENISDSYCRVNMAEWKRRKLNPKWLFNMFIMSAQKPSGDKDLFLSCLSQAQKAVFKGKTDFTAEEWQSFTEQYEKAGIHPVHHSESYRMSENPSYRIVKREYAALLPMLEKIPSANKEGTFVIAIDGRAGAGKTTVADLLGEITGGETVRLDHFFLPPEMRTQERLSSPGGNVHFERFNEEVIPFLHSRKSFDYRIFDCKTMAYGKNQTVGNSPVIIVEGSYSLHPAFGDYADLTVFCDVGLSRQLERIRLRNGEEAAEKFKNIWIPLEETYFKAYNIKDKAQVILKPGEEKTDENTCC